MPTILPFLLALSSIASSTNALAFSPQQFQLPNIFNALLAPKTKNTFRYTHLEGNGQIWQASSGPNTKASVVIDPLASQLDFGIPWGYRANKLSLSEAATIDLICEAEPSHCLLTMGLDDHTHLPTLQRMRERMPELKYVVAPSCEKKLLDFGLTREQMIVLDHGESCELSDNGVSVTATEGALVGPPWQKRENGFILQLNNNDDNNGKENEKEGLSIYYEPHADVVLNNIKNLQADIMVSPVTKQSLPAQVPKEGQYTLVYGGEQTLKIAESLGVRTIVPLGNGALDIEGPLAGLVSSVGDASDFEILVEERNVGRDDGIRVAKACAGVPLTVSV